MMDIKEALQVIEENLAVDYGNLDHEQTKRLDEAIDMAIGALRAQADGDTISRKAAIGAICSACGKIDCDQMDTCEMLKLPSAQPVAKDINVPINDCISRQAAIDAADDMVEPQESEDKE